MPDPGSSVGAVIKDLAIEGAKNIFTGNFSELSTMENPIYVHCDTTFADVLKYDFTFYEHYLGLAQKSGKSPDEDPVLWMKHAVTA